MDHQASGAEDPNKHHKKKPNEDDSKNKKLVCTYLSFLWSTVLELLEFNN